MQTIRISPQVETALTVVVSALSIIVLVVGLASMMGAGAPATADTHAVREVRLDTVVITGRHAPRVASSSATAALQPLVQ